MKRIALIGAGQLGSRHLQGLARIELPASVQVMDVSPKALRLAQERFLELPLNPGILSLTFTTTLEDLYPEIDLAIIATTSQVRLQVLQELLTIKTVKSLILEKVVFQSSREFEAAGALLREKKISCWVNCPRRMAPFYRELEEALRGGGPIEYRVGGGDWGLGSSAIHFIDQAAFLARDCEYLIDAEGLDPFVRPSKRENFVEFTGRLQCRFARGSTLEMASEAGSEAPLQITITAPRLRASINETGGRATLARADENWEEKTSYFVLPYQSEMTHVAAQEILLTGSSQLTPFDESYALHAPLLTALSRHLEKVQGRPCLFCPIT